MKLTARTLLIALVLSVAPAARPAGRQVITSPQPQFESRLHPLGRLPGVARLDSVISLPLRNQTVLSNLLAQIYDRTGTNFHHFLSPQQFNEQFGPSEGDYQKLIAFATAHGLTVTGTHANRALLDVNGAVADFEKVFHVNLLLYPHPAGAREFYAPDTAPSIDVDVPILGVIGLDNYTLPRPRFTPTPELPPAGGLPRTGSGNSGAYTGKDFRAAYFPGVGLTGLGETVGLFELDGYYAADITNYLTNRGLPIVPVNNVLLDGFSGMPGGANEEVALDIEMAISMAPGLSEVIVYEGVTPEDILNRMATGNEARQLSCSWGFPTSATTRQIFEQFAAQGQTFLVAAGDSGAFSGAVAQPADSPYVTVVGGTVLSTTGPEGAWVAESAWPFGSGGISSLVPIPVWQQGIDMSRNGGSATMRNVPDISLIAHNVEFVAENGATISGQGTSFSAPLWAGIVALANQQAANAAQPPVGFLNPALYAVGKGTADASSFHDIVSGNNTTSNSPNAFFAVSGYDLCTGWGTPKGANFINALLAPAPGALMITPPLGFTAVGASGGPFNVSSQTYSLTNAGLIPLAWRLNDDIPFWLDVSPSSGKFTPGGPPTRVVVKLNSAANALLLEAYSGTLWFTNLNTGIAENRDFSLFVGNGGFESGNFSNWVLTGKNASGYNETAGIDDDAFGVNIIPGVDDGVFVHSGAYGVALGENGSVSRLTHTLPTQAGQRYLLSFWLDNIPDPTGVTPNQFACTWNGVTLFSATNLPAFGWTNRLFKVSATGAQTSLQFSSRNDPGAFGLDDITVQKIVAPAIQSVTQSRSGLTLTWNAVAGLAYEVQFTTDLTQNSWTNLTSFTALGPTATATDPILPSGQRFYRIVLLP